MAINELSMRISNMNVQFQINAGTSSKRRGVGVILNLTAYTRHPITRGPAFNRENKVSAAATDK